MTLNWDYDDNGVALRSQSWIHANLVKPDAWPFLFCTLASLCVCVRAHVRMHVWICLQQFCLTNTLKKGRICLYGLWPQRGTKSCRTHEESVHPYVHMSQKLAQALGGHTYLCMCVCKDSPCVLQNFVPLLSRIPTQFKGYSWQFIQRSKGTGDHLLP